VTATLSAPLGPYFIGNGLHTALGRGVPANVRALREGLRAPDQVTFEFAGSHATLAYHLLAQEPLVDQECRFHRVLERVIQEALDESGLNAAERSELTLFVGSSSVDISLLEMAYRRDLQSDTSARPMSANTSFGNMAAQLARRFGLKGADFTINTACTASANALLHASTLIRRGIIQHALVLGVEICNAVTALGFSSLQLLSDDTMKPFDERRSGLVLGEACAAVVLSAQPRNRPSWRLLSGSTLCDTFSPSAATPDGSTIALVIEQALKAANLESTQITALKVHGTASRANDEAEAAGTRRVFESPPALCALKPRIGHTLGACGLTELILMCGAAAEDFLPGTPGIGGRTSDMGLRLVQEPQLFPGGNLMFNYFGFGGSNTSLILASPDV
jgi:3-oxoacyl-[acyl-carrier-protein] synthase I